MTATADTTAPRIGRFRRWLPRSRRGRRKTLLFAVVTAVAVAVSWLVWPSASLPERAVIREEGAIPVVFSPDGRILVTRRDGCGVTLRDAATGRPLTFWKGLGAGSVELASFSPDGTLLMVSGYDGLSKRFIAFLDAATARERAVARKVPPVGWSPRFSADRSTSKILMHDPTFPTRFEMWTLDTDTAAVRARWVMPVGSYSGWALSHDGRTFASPDPADPLGVTVTLRNLLTGDETGRLPCSDRTVVGPPCLAFAPDDRSLAVARADGTIELWDLATVRRTVVGRHPGGRPPMQIEFGPDARTVASTGGPIFPSLSGPDLIRRASALVRTRGRHSDLPEVLLWEVEKKRLRARMVGYVPAVLSPDGRTLSAYDVVGRRTVIWDVPAASR